MLVQRCSPDQFACLLEKCFAAMRCCMRCGLPRNPLFFLAVLMLVPGMCNVVRSEETDLDRYVAKPDDSYAWKVVKTVREPGLTTFLIDMKSQTWRSSDEVNRTVWQHWLIVAKPDGVKADTAMLFIAGGRERR